MGKSVFISYCHKQGEWVQERLLPVVRAAGCEIVYIDTERFTAGRGVKGQMDAWQDRAEVSLLVLTPDYLASEYCRHEMDRGLAAIGARPALGADLPTAPKPPTAGLPDSGDLSVAIGAGSGDPRTTELESSLQAAEAGQRPADRHAKAWTPTGADHMVLSVLRQACDMSAFAGRPDPLLWVDLTDDRRADPWALLLKSAPWLR